VVTMTRVIGLGELPDEVAAAALSHVKVSRFVVDAFGDIERDGVRVTRLDVPADEVLPAGHYLVTQFDPQVIDRVEVDFHADPAVIEHIFASLRAAQDALRASTDAPPPPPAPPGVRLGPEDQLWRMAQTVAYRAVRFRHATVGPATVAEVEAHLRPLVGHAFWLLRALAHHDSPNDIIEIGDLGDGEQFMADWQ